MLYKQKATLYSKVYDKSSRTDKYIRNVLDKVHFEGGHSFSFGNQTQSSTDSFFACVPYENDKILNLTRIDPYIDEDGLIVPNGYPYIHESKYFLGNDYYHMNVEDNGLKFYQQEEKETLVIKKGDIIVKGVLDIDIESVNDLLDYEHYVIKNVEILDYSIANQNHYELGG